MQRILNGTDPGKTGAVYAGGCENLAHGVLVGADIRGMLAVANQTELMRDISNGRHSNIRGYRSDAGNLLTPANLGNFFFFENGDWIELIGMFFADGTFLPGKTKGAQPQFLRF